MNTEKQVFSEQLVELADIAKAMAHPGRLKILQILAREKSCICGQVVDQLPFSQSTVSQHLRELKRVGLITGEISGPRTCYCLNLATLQRAQDQFATLFAGIGCCGPRTNKGETFEL